ncbi:hypothetical protein EDEG_02077 [Edhazardia aedis USNM 41457]|uniref:Uncharacterized protein n=1 Tax=Edhazardia aedis (strain USNM 41457) TaxID=1003232 RepID=J9D7Y2_EDHAE|nr:hypothetical protein EDEG_02077 [Edhazardia aedis USNM 41457]|eukprot:EJW03609.1 hypothetical protein EDEG_02077 [Edhazardia aedis USNM 41457]
MVNPDICANLSNDGRDLKSTVEVSEVPKQEKTEGVSANNIQPTTMELKNRKLNIHQLNAVIQLAQNKSYKIFGPPGTGKTMTLVEIIYQLMCRNKKVLVCGPSNASIDNIIHGFISLNSGYDFVRVGNSNKCSENLLKYNFSEINDNVTKDYNKKIDYLLNTELLKSYRKNEEDFLNKKDNESNTIQDNTLNNDQIKIMLEIERLYTELSIYTRERSQKKAFNYDLVFSTLNGSLKLSIKRFDWVIIDECCQALEIDAFCSVFKGKNFILAGDPCQLGPITNLKKEICFFERITAVKTIILREQYRMQDLLMRFSNKYFYNSKIISRIQSDFKFFNSSPIIFIDTYRSKATESKFQQSYYNIHEIYIVKKA